VEQSQAAADLSRTPLSGQPQTNVSLPFSRVLLVDDDLNTLQILNEAFRNTRAEISTADSAVKALEIAKEWNPDLLISDLAMPGRDGYWLIRQLRPDGRENATGCAVALTASATQEERTRALAAGFDTVLSKPMEPGEVLRMAKLLLRQQSDRNQMFVETKVSTKLNQTISVLTGKKILLVEDDVISAALLSVALEQKGMELKSATRASEALDILQDWCPDAIISDLGLPDEDGFSMIQKIRSFPGAKKDVPALALTGYGNEEGDRALQAGFQNYKTKPVDPDSVVHLLMQMLNHH
jgi:CheY-like chemotaxis protein